VYQKCLDAGLVSEPGCGSIQKEVISEWRRRPRAAAGSEATLLKVKSDGTNAGHSIESFDQIDEAIRQAKVTRQGVPSTIDGCPTGLDHLADKLPVCRQNVQLMKLRELSLLTDASFRADLAAGLTLAQVATRTAQAARSFDATLPANEKAMLEAAAFDGVAQARVRALRDVPSRCDAAPANAYGMQEAAYQAYVASYIAAQVNRAVSAIAACRAGARK
jgi:hypothetical protein